MSDTVENKNDTISDDLRNEEAEITKSVAKINTEEVFKDQPVHLLDSTWTLWYTRPKAIAINLYLAINPYLAIHLNEIKFK